MADADAGTVATIDPGNGAIGGTVEVGRRPQALSVGPEAVWVADTGSAQVSRITP